MGRWRQAHLQVRVPGVVEVLSLDGESRLGLWVSVLSSLFFLVSLAPAGPLGGGTSEDGKQGWLVPSLRAWGPRGGHREDRAVK